MIAPKQIRKTISNFYWVILAVVAILVRWVASGHPEGIEAIYSRGIFVFIRTLFGAVTHLSPIPFMYLFIGVVLFLLIKKLVVLFRKDEKWLPKLAHFAQFLLNIVAALVFLFLVLWGYNYQRIPIETQMGFVPSPLSVKELKAELDRTTTLLIQQRLAIPEQSNNALDASFYPPDFEHTINTVVCDWLSQNGFPDYAKANARFLQPKGVLLYNSTAGIYFPWVGESNIDAGLHALSKPYVLAHEFAHAYGWGDEGTCNFIAYLACLQADNPFIQYCGLLGYWRTLASNYKGYKPKEYATFRATLPEGIIADLDIINYTHGQYPDFFPRFRDATYDAFLKAQGIDEGLDNYNRVLMLGRAWRLKEEGLN